METTAVIYRIILLGHIVSAVVGFGALIAHGTFHARAVRSTPTEAARLLRITADGSKPGEYGIYGVLAFGIILIALSNDVYRYSDAWVSAAFVVWFAIVGLVHGLVRPSRSKLQELATSITAESPDEGHSSELGDDDRAKPLIARLAIGEACIQLLLVVALVLMIWKPGT